MATEIATSLPSPGFKFENHLRNAYLTSKGFPAQKEKKTGTTICGIVFKDGVVLGGDTRATQGTIVADKYSEKIHRIANNIYCCGAGTAADTSNVTETTASQLELHRLATDRIVPVVAAQVLISQHLFRYQGHVSAALVLGGVDNDGPSLYNIHPHGSSTKSDYTTMGSGSLAAISVLEKQWKPDLPLEEAKKVVRNAICAGVYNDLASGNNIDLCIITKEATTYLRLYEKAQVKGQVIGNYDYKPGTTAVLTTEVIPLEIVENIVKRSDEDMDTE